MYTWFYLSLFTLKNQIFSNTVPQLFQTVSWEKRHPTFTEHPKNFANFVALLTPWLTSWLCNGFTGWLLDPNVQPVGRAELFSCDCKLWSPEEQTDTPWIHRPGLLTVLGTDSVRSCRVLAILWTLAETETCDSATRQSRLAVLPAASGRKASHSQDLSNPHCGSMQKQDIHPLKRHKHSGIILICVKEHWAEQKCSKKTWFLVIGLSCESKKKKFFYYYLPVFFPPHFDFAFTFFAAKKITWINRRRGKKTWQKFLIACRQTLKCKTWLAKKDKIKLIKISINY